MAGSNAESVDVLIVGAGPAGAAAALGCVRRSCGRVLVVERAQFPRTRPCASILSPRARRQLERTGLWGAIEPVAYAVYGLRVVAPSGRSHTLSGATAHTVPRARLDAMLLDAALAEGARLASDTVVTGLLEEAGVVVGVQTHRGPLRARWTVLATGSAQDLLPCRRVGDTLHACTRRYQGVATTPHLVEVAFDSALVPGFVWLVPEDSEVTTLGIVSAPESRRAPSDEAHAELVEKWFGTRLEAAEPLGPAETHPIACSTHVGEVARPGLLCIGEAARLANRGSGEGIAYALESGALAAESLGLGKRKRARAEWVAQHYRRSVSRRMGPALRAGALFSRLGGPGIEALVRGGSSEWVQAVAAGAVSLLGR